MDQKEICFRLNKFIAFNRRLQLKQNALGHFKQQEFVKIYPNEQNYGEIPKDQICSPYFLSRLEQGKVTAKIHVYDLLLAKLGARFVFRESNNKTQDYLCQRLVNLFFCSCMDIQAYRNEVHRYSTFLKNNCLWVTDLEAIEIILQWFETNSTLNCSKFEELNAKFYIFNPKIRHILLYYFAYSSYFNPILWPSIKHVKELILSNNIDDEILLTFLSFDQRQYFNLIKIYYKNKGDISKMSYRYHLFVKFKKVIIYDNLHTFETDDDFLKTLLDEFITQNSQFKKMVQRVCSNVKYNRNETRYLFLNFLNYEPFPHSFRKILFHRTLPKITRDDYKKEFLVWENANY